MLKSIDKEYKFDWLNRSNIGGNLPNCFFSHISQIMHAYPSLRYMAKLFSILYQRIFLKRRNNCFHFTYLKQMLQVAFHMLILLAFYYASQRNHFRKHPGKVVS